MRPEHIGVRRQGINGKYITMRLLNRGAVLNSNGFGKNIHIVATPSADTTQLGRSHISLKIEFIRYSTSFFSTNLYEPYFKLNRE